MKKIFFLIILIFGAISANETSESRPAQMPETATVILKAAGEKEIILDSMKIIRK